MVESKKEEIASANGLQLKKKTTSSKSPTKKSESPDPDQQFDEKLQEMKEKEENYKQMKKTMSVGKKKLMRRMSSFNPQSNLAFQEASSRNLNNSGIKQISGAQDSSVAK